MPIGARNYISFILRSKHFIWHNFGSANYSNRRTNKMEELLVGNNTSRTGVFIGFTLTAIFWCFSPAPLRSQTVSGTILGQIQDQQGAAISKAEISARNLETGAIRKTVSEDNG